LRCMGLVLGILIGIGLVSSYPTIRKAIDRHLLNAPRAERPKLTPPSSLRYSPIRNFKDRARFVKVGSPGDTISIANSTGRYIFINYFMTTCPPCRVEFPSLVQLARKMKDLPITFILASYESPEELALLFKEKSKDLPVYSSIDTANISVWCYPSTFVLSPDLEVIYEHQGPANWSDSSFVSELDALVGHAHP